MAGTGIRRAGTVDAPESSAGAGAIAGRFFRKGVASRTGCTASSSVGGGVAIGRAGRTAKKLL
jgi:hypothetical protein